jgi:hypothetical protein
MILLLVIISIISQIQWDSTDASYGNLSEILIQRGPMFFLYNSKASPETPIVFEDIYKYSTYVDTLQLMGINSPEVFIQEIVGTQGNSEYKMRANPLNPAMVDYTLTEEFSQPNSKPPAKPKRTLPYDRKLYMDSLAYSIANTLSVNQINAINKLELTKSVLSSEPSKRCKAGPEDIVPITKKGLTADPMSTNWGGVEFSRNLVKDGYYAGNEILRYAK